MKKTKKYYVTDESGDKYTVEEELDEVTKDEDEPDMDPVPTSDEAALTDDEIVALKKLAAVAEKLLAKVEPEVTDEDNDDEEVLDEDEEILDTEEDIEVKATDSKKSFGAISSKKKAKDSMNDAISIEDAWQKRYGG